MLGQGPTYWSKASCTFEVCDWSFWANWRPCARYYNW
jgi:hypothetical protein